MHIILYEPEFGLNTGNIGRTCLGTGIALHLIEPLGFKLTDKEIKRAGLDYWKDVDVKVWKNLDEYLHAYPDKRIVCTSARQGMPLQNFDYNTNDAYMFGPETRGIPAHVLARFQDRLRIPTKNSIRSLNLANSVAIVAFFALDRVGDLDKWL